jgi:hypothetical protein
VIYLVPLNSQEFISVPHCLIWWNQHHPPLWWVLSSLWLGIKSFAQEEPISGIKVNFQVQLSFPQYTATLERVISFAFEWWCYLASESATTSHLWMVLFIYLLSGLSGSRMQMALVGSFLTFLSHSLHMRHWWINLSHGSAMPILKISWDQDLECVPDGKWERNAHVFLEHSNPLQLPG